MRTDRRTGRRTDVQKLLVAFLNSAKALKMFVHTIPTLMGGACGTYGERERCAQGFGVET